MALISGYKITRWDHNKPPDESELRSLLNQAGYHAYRWSNLPGEIYEAHSHQYHKIIYVVQGSITFVLPEINERVQLSIGDRLDLPRGLVHEAEVGAEGVVCLEAHHG